MAGRIIGSAAGVVLVLSSIVHSVFGWKQLSAQLVAAKVPSELLVALRIGWQFAGVAMLVFGVTAAALFLKGMHGEPAARLAVTATGIGYMGFGAWAFAISAFDPFFMIFLVPGVLLVAASWMRTRTRENTTVS